ncbi:unnamed protein product [Alopecurus aequalis]
MASAVVSKGPAMTSLVKNKKLLAEPSASDALADADAGDRRLARDLTMPSFFSQDVLDRFGAPTSLGGLLAPGSGWSVAKEDDEAVYLKEPWAGDKDDTPVPRYNRRIDLPAGAYKMDKIKAEMKDGMLRVTVLKVKEEERKDVFQVQVE